MPPKVSKAQQLQDAIDRSEQLDGQWIRERALLQAQLAFTQRYLARQVSERDAAEQALEKTKKRRVELVATTDRRQHMLRAQAERLRVAAATDADTLTCQQLHVAQLRDDVSRKEEQTEGTRAQLAAVSVDGGAVAADLANIRLDLEGTLKHDITSLRRDQARLDAEFREAVGVVNQAEQLLSHRTPRRHVVVIHAVPQHVDRLVEALAIAAVNTDGGSARITGVLLVPSESRAADLVSVEPALDTPTLSPIDRAVATQVTLKRLRLDDGMENASRHIAQCILAACLQSTGEEELLVVLGGTMAEAAPGLLCLTMTPSSSQERESHGLPLCIELSELVQVLSDSQLARVSLLVDAWGPNGIAAFIPARLDDKSTGSIADPVPIVIRYAAHPSASSSSAAPTTSLDFAGALWTSFQLVCELLAHAAQQSPCEDGARLRPSQIWTASGGVSTTETPPSGPSLPSFAGTLADGATVTALLDQFTVGGGSHDETFTFERVSDRSQWPTWVHRAHRAALRYDSKFSDGEWPATVLPSQTAEAPSPSSNWVGHRRALAKDWIGSWGRTEGTLRCLFALVDPNATSASTNGGAESISTAECEELVKTWCTTTLRSQMSARGWRESFGYVDDRPALDDVDIVASLADVDNEAIWDAVNARAGATTHNNGAELQSPVAMVVSTISAAVLCAALSKTVKSEIFPVEGQPWAAGSAGQRCQYCYWITARSVATLEAARGAVERDEDCFFGTRIHLATILAVSVTGHALLRAAVEQSVQGKCQRLFPARRKQVALGSSPIVVCLRAVRPCGSRLAERTASAARHLAPLGGEPWRVRLAVCIRLPVVFPSGLSETERDVVVRAVRDAQRCSFFQGVCLLVKQRIVPYDVARSLCLCVETFTVAPTNGSTAVPTTEGDKGGDASLSIVRRVVASHSDVAVALYAPPVANCLLRPTTTPSADGMISGDATAAGRAAAAVAGGHPGQRYWGLRTRRLRLEEDTSQKEDGVRLSVSAHFASIIAPWVLSLHITEAYVQFVWP